LDNSDEIRKLIDESVAKKEVLELNEWASNGMPARKFNSTAVSPTK